MSKVRRKIVEDRIRNNRDEINQLKLKLASQGVDAGERVLTLLIEKGMEAQNKSEELLFKAICSEDTAVGDRIERLVMRQLEIVENLINRAMDMASAVVALQQAELNLRVERFNAQHMSEEEAEHLFRDAI